MTLEEIAKLPKGFLTATDIAPYLKSDPVTIRWQTHNEPEMLGFRVIVAKSRVKVPKVPFVRFCGGDDLV